MKDKEQTYYRSLYEIAAGLNSKLDPDSVLKAIVESVARALEAKACSLMLLGADRKLLLHAVACGLSDQYIGKGPVSADKSIAEALAGHPVAVMDATEDARVQYRRQAKEEGIASILCVPLKLGGDVVGVIRVYTASPRHFDDADIYFASAVANLGAIALRNANMYDLLKREYRKLRDFGSAL